MLVLLAGSLSSGAALVVVSAATGTVIGHAPAASGVVINNQSRPGMGLRNGDVAEVSYGFSDVDGDTESGTAIQWLSNDAAIGGATASVYTVIASDARTDLTYKVIPGTDPAITDPAAGAEVTSAAAMIVDSVPADWTISPGPLLWPDADTYCSGLAGGARLPTEIELQTLFVAATRWPEASPGAGTISNSDFCTTHGWPLGGMWGGLYGLLLVQHVERCARPPGRLPEQRRHLCQLRL